LHETQDSIEEFRVTTGMTNADAEFAEYVPESHAEHNRPQMRQQPPESPKPNSEPLPAPTPASGPCLISSFETLNTRVCSCVIGTIKNCES
jgi:hypothetical protein